MSEQREEKFHMSVTPDSKKESEVPPTTWQELAHIAQRVGGDFNMTVKRGEIGGGSYFNTAECSITFDPEHITKKPDLAKFVAGHEGAHRAITPGPKGLGLTVEKTQQLYGQTGFGYLQNVIEDGAVNTWLGERYPGLAPAIESTYNDQFKQENAILATPEVAALAAKLGYQPKFAQCGSEYLRDWHQQRFSQNLDPDVAKILQRTIHDARKSMSVLPNPKQRNQTEIITTAQERFRINTERLWPQFQKLVAEDKHTEELRQMINQPEAFDQLSADIKDGLRSAIDDIKGDNELATELPLPQASLSPAVSEALEKLWQSLPSATKQELRQKAQAELDQFEDVLNKAMRGQLNSDLPESHAQAYQRQQAQAESATRQQAMSQEKNKLQENLEKIRRASMTPYEQIRSELAGSIDSLYLRLRRILKPEEYGSEETGFPSGQRLDIARAMQASHSTEQKHKLFIREQAPDRRDYRFWHLIDVSGSMKGNKITEAQKGFIIAGEALDRVEDINSDVVTVHQGMTAFHNRIFPIKKIQQRFTKDVRQELSALPNKTADNDAGTNTYQATVDALEHIKTNLGTTGNYILTYTDGEPNTDIRQSLKDILVSTKADRQKMNIKVGLVWLEQNKTNPDLQTMVRNYGYDFGLVMSANTGKAGSTEKNFAQALGDLLEDIVNYPEKY